MAFPSDLEIARGATLTPLVALGAAMGLGPHLLEPYGEHVMKVKPAAIEELAQTPRAKYVVVTAITPTPLGEGKTTTTVGLGQGFAHIGKRATVAIRQPSMGPTFADQGWGGGWWLQPGRPHGDAQPAPHRGHARGDRGAQPARRDD